MIEKDRKLYLQAKKILSRKLTLKKGSFVTEVKMIHAKKRMIESLVKRFGSPLYLFDPEEARKNIDFVKKTFEDSFKNSELYYAVKSNPYHPLLKEMVKKNVGLDVSSLQELKSALSTATDSIIFTGPAKTSEELQLALKNRSRVILQLDSFSELKKIGRLSSKAKLKIRCGIRVSSKIHGLWNKFGIPLRKLSLFFKESQKFRYVDLCGIQSHMSFNVDSVPYVEFIKDLGSCLQNLKEDIRSKITFVDLGGGFIPKGKESVYAWEEAKGEIERVIREDSGKQESFPRYYAQPALPLQDYVRQIREATRKYLDLYVSVTYMFEPGRLLSFPSMHLVMKISDIKSAQLGIADAGTNMIGWEKFEFEYAPLVNITNPSFKEKKFVLFGSLCTPHDIWGYYMFAKKIEEDDIVVIPNQGAYVYTMAQNFIKPIPPVHEIK